MMEDEVKLLCNVHVAEAVIRRTRGLKLSRKLKNGSAVMSACLSVDFHLSGRRPQVGSDDLGEQVGRLLGQVRIRLRPLGREYWRVIQ